MKISLDDTRIEKLSIRSKEYTIWDKDIAGFGVRVRPSGQKSFVLHKWISGISKKCTLGRFPVMGTPEARHACLVLLQEVSHRGNLPARKPHAPRFDEFVATVWHQSQFVHYKASTQVATRSYIHARLLPAFGKLPLDAITKSVIMRWFTGYAQIYPGGARRALEILVSILGLAVKLGHIPFNPAKDIPKPKRRTGTRFLTEEELTVFWRVLRQEKNDRQGVEIVRLLLLTGCRHREICHLRWDMVHAQKLRLPDSKSGPRDVHLCRQAASVLKRRRKGKSPWVFPSSNNSNTPRDNITNFWFRVRREAGIEDVRVHDLRHTFASHAVMQGVSLPMVSKLLGHRDFKMTLRYAHVSDKDAEAAAERVGVALNAMLNGAGVET